MIGVSSGRIGTSPVGRRLMGTDRGGIYDEVRTLRQANHALQVRIGELTADLAAARADATAMAQHLQAKHPYSHAADILEEVAKARGLKVFEVCSPNRHKALSNARHEFFYRCAAETGLKLTAIAALVGGLDHTSIVHGIHRHATRHGLPLPRGMKPRHRDADYRGQP